MVELVEIVSLLTCSCLFGGILFSLGTIVLICTMCIDGKQFFAAKVVKMLGMSEAVLYILFGSIIMLSSISQKL